jgi:hypothetical protein
MMGEGIDGSKPIGPITSAKRAMMIAEYEARKASKRGDTCSETNLRALVSFIAGFAYQEMKECLH